MDGAAEDRAEGGKQSLGEQADRGAKIDVEAQMAPTIGLPLILASASPRRADLLTQVGIPHEVRVSTVTEEADVSGCGPAGVAEAHARDKALDVAKKSPGRLVLGADTVVVLDGRVLGKPASPDTAREMLKLLSGRWHQVITAVAITLDGGGCVSPQADLLALEHVTTRVEFRPLNDEEIDAYVAGGEPMDKAGAYGIQGRGALLVRKIEGCYFNVVGLPLSRTYELLSEIGHQVPGVERVIDRGRRS